MAAGVVLVGLLYTVSWALAMLAGSAGAVLSDRTSCYLTARIAEQLHAVGGVDHLERPAYLTELDLLQQNLRLLGNAPRQILLVIQVLVRTIGIVVILAVIFPVLGVLPLAACFPVMAEPAALSSALERADASAVAASLPDGLDTRLGRSFTGGQELSGGQWQRLALARGMMRDLPLLLILDEPTASLDAITEAALFERYLSARELARETGAITLLVSHRFSTVRIADMIVVLDQGRIAASGDHASLIRAGGLYAELYELQARAYR